MPTPDEFLGGLSVLINRTDTSPLGYDLIEKIFTAAGFGQSVPEVKTTNFESAAQEYIGGLKDGNDFSISCNRVHVTNSCQDFLELTSVGSVLSMRVIMRKTDVSPNLIRRYDFSVLNKGASNDPQVEDKNTITFNFKITGPITRSTTAGS
jgi:hypothetical protein